MKQTTDQLMTFRSSGTGVREEWNVPNLQREPRASQ
jgi:hypothetical protein